MMNKVHWLLIWLFVEFGNPSVRAFLISGWWTQMFVISCSCSLGCLMNIRDGQEAQVLPGLSGSKSKFYPDLCVS